MTMTKQQSYELCDKQRLNFCDTNKLPSSSSLGDHFCHLRVRWSTYEFKLDELDDQSAEIGNHTYLLSPSSGL